MQDSVYSALFGALSNELRMSNIANNLANVNTTAYKKDSLAFHDTFARFAHDYLNDSRTYLRDTDMWPQANVMAKPRLSSQQTDFSQGNLAVTGNQLDFALSGKGFFKVQAGDETLYTRAGAFVASENGTLMTPQGHPVMVGGGSITIPAGAKVSVGESGAVYVNGEPAGSFDLADFTNPEALEKIGSNYYRLQQGSEEIAPEDVTVQQGFIEKGNVEVVTEMVAMIETQRAFEVYNKMIQGTDDLDKKLITQVGNANV